MKDYFDEGALFEEPYEPNDDAIKRDAGAYHSYRKRYEYREVGEMTKFTIQLKPVTKKNHSRIIWTGRPGNKKPRLIPSKSYTEYEKNAVLQCPVLHINQPVNVEAHYYMPTRHRIDLTNLHEALHDVMVKAGTLTDDNCNIIRSTDGSRVHYDKNNPRTEVVITFFEE